MPGTTPTSLDALVLVEGTNGITVIPQLSELRRLNWFDGKLLRADDLRVEQDHMRGLVRRANRAGGPGVVEGFTITLDGDGLLHVDPGMAIDLSGRSLPLPVDVSLDIADLIAKTAATAPAATTMAATAVKEGFADCVEPQISGQAPVGGGRWYVISVGWAEGLCGSEEVYGRLCEDACTTSSDRPWRIDGLVFRARAITPLTALATSSAVSLDARHERSRVASALFADERDDAGSLIFGSGLRTGVWCSGAAAATAAYDEVPLALVGRAGGTTTFLDEWSARRERIEAPPRRYWDGRMSMRPWGVFLAQVLQFQCQLPDVLDGGVPTGPGGADPCAERQRVLESAVAELEKRPLAREGSEDDAVVELLKQQMVSLRLPTGVSGARQVLLDGGIVELPPAGYLPVDPAGPPALEEQVRALLGDGVDLTFCVTRQDAVARGFEEAQHLDRISLLTGLDDPERRQAVEIIVPDADVQDVVSARDGWEGRLQIDDRARGGRRSAIARPEGAEAGFQALDGAGRVETRHALALGWAGAAQMAPGAFLEASADRDPFSLNKGEAVSFSASGDVVVGSGADGVSRGSLHGTFRLGSAEQRPGGTLLRGIVDAVTNWRATGGGGEPESHSLNVDRAPATLLRRRTDDGGTQVLVSVSMERRPSLTVSLTYYGRADRVDIAGFVADDTAPEAVPANLPGGVSRSDVERPASASDSGVTEAAARAVGTPDFGREFARLTLHRQPGAASPGSPPRVVAEGALRALEDALGEPGYAQDASRRLFPGGDDTSSLRLRATRDWVLFRRRAVLRCGGTVEVPVRTDSYAVYGAVSEGEVARRRHLGEVRFTRGSATLAGGSDAVAGAWDDIAHGDRLVAAGVIEGSPGGDKLGLTRVDELIQAISGVTKPAPGLQPKILQPDPGLDAHGADGILVVVAVDEQQAERC